MSENVRFYKCKICGNIIGLINGNMEHITCCGKPMELMKANSTDAAVEKHVPVYEKIENEIVVKVGEVNIKRNSPTPSNCFFSSLYAYMEKQAAATDTLLPFAIVVVMSSRTISEILSKIFICMQPP